MNTATAFDLFLKKALGVYKDTSEDLHTGFLNALLDAFPETEMPVYVRNEAHNIVPVRSIKFNKIDDKICLVLDFIQ